MAVAPAVAMAVALAAAPAVAPAAALAVATVVVKVVGKAVDCSTRSSQHQLLLRHTTQSMHFHRTQGLAMRSLNRQLHPPELCRCCLRSLPHRRQPHQAAHLGSAPGQSRNRRLIR